MYSRRRGARITGANPILIALFPVLLVVAPALMVCRFIVKTVVKELFHAAR